MSSSDSYYIALLTNIPIYLIQYVAPVLYILGNIGNFLSLFIFFKKSWRKNVCVFYFNICLINSTIFLNSTLIGSIFTLGFNINVQNYNVVVCKLFYYVSYVTSTYFPIILILASVDRLLISSQNVDTRLYSSKRLAHFSVSTAMFIWSVFSFHVLIEVSIQELYPTVFICYYNVSESYLNFFEYSILVISIIIPLIMIILSILAFKNVRQIRSIPRQQRKQKRTMNKKDFQLLRCLYVHNISYVVFSILIVFGVVYDATLKLKTPSSLEEAINTFLNDFGSFLHYIPYSNSFFIFISVSKAFRVELKRFAYKICGKDLAQVREEENNQQEVPRDNVEPNNAIVSTIRLPD
jgi:hypothetical protein